MSYMPYCVFVYLPINLSFYVCYCVLQRALLLPMPLLWAGG
jgi:hypothetical protein